jgi:RNA-directed DNA polymerase
MMKSVHLMKNLLPGTLRRHAGFWQELSHVHELGVLINMAPHHLQLLSAEPMYRCHTVPKKDGSRREIEDPHPPLKLVLRRINHYLQAAYHFKRPESVHGFCISPRHEEDRNAISNARRHVGKDYLLNLDMEDFFHQISADRVAMVLQRHFPGFNEDLVELIVRLTTRHGRLPMGAPTSPALSNFACLEMDAEMEALSAHLGLTYTRFADDLSFSATASITEGDELMVRDILLHHGFRVNEDKVKHYGVEDDRMVTGLLVKHDGVHLPQGYLSKLKEEIGRLKSVLMVDRRYQTGMSNKKLHLLKKEIQGKINFAAMAIGASSEAAMELAEAYEGAVYVPEEYESGSWLEIPYSG